MSFLLSCPTCGARPVDEFHCGGEVLERVADASDPRRLFRYLYIRRNVAGPQAEWWFHASGCREWLQAVRDTRDNRVLETARPGRRAPAETGGDA